PGVCSDVTDLNPELDNALNLVGVAYLRFPPPGGVPTSATLTLHTQTFASAAGGSGHICRVDDDTWSETTMTWANRPPVSMLCTSGDHAVGPDEEVSWDVTSLLTSSGDQNLAIMMASSDSPHYFSREAGGCTTGPRLVLQVSPLPPDAGAPPGPDGGAS